MPENAFSAFQNGTFPKCDGIFIDDDIKEFQDLEYTIPENTFSAFPRVANAPSPSFKLGNSFISSLQLNKNNIESTLKQC